MTIKELQTWILNHDQPDSWWVAIDGEVQDDLMALPDINTLKDHHPLTKISLLHVSKSEEENAEWETYEKAGPSVFKVTRDTGGLGNFKTIPRAAEKKEEHSTQILKEPEPVAKKIAEEPNEPLETSPTTRVSRKNVGNRAKQFFEKQNNRSKTSSESNGTISGEALASNEEFTKLKKEVKDLKIELAEMRELMEDLRVPVSEARAMLEEREQFLEMSENSLFEKAQKQEVLQTELAQRSDELSSRERQIEEKEKNLKAADKQQAVV